MMRAASAQFVVTARNLAVWSTYRGVDPETDRFAGPSSRPPRSSRRSDQRRRYFPRQRRLLTTIPGELRLMRREMTAWSRGGVRALAVAGLFAITACDLTDSLLEAKDPDLINPDDVQSAEGALALANGALEFFRDLTAGDESTWLFGGLLADEWSTSSTFVQNDETDQRKIQTNNSTITGQFRDLARVRLAADWPFVPSTNTAPSRRERLPMCILQRIRRDADGAGFLQRYSAEPRRGRRGDPGVPLPVDSGFGRALRRTTRRSRSRRRRTPPRSRFAGGPRWARRVRC